MPKAMINRPNAVKMLDPDDPNDNAFELVITFVFCCDVCFPKKKLNIWPYFYHIPMTHFALTQMKAADDRSGGRWQSG